MPFAFLGLAPQLSVKKAKGKPCPPHFFAHPNKLKYPNQKIYIVNLNGYVYLVPFVRKNTQTIFLKTIFPSRKLTKKYLGDGGA